MKKNNQPFLIVLADDHPLVRAGVQATLEGLDAYRIVGEAEDGAAVRKHFNPPR